MTTAQIVTIGNELLQGRVLDQNTYFLSSRLTQMGIRVTRHSSCEDDESTIAQTLQTALSSSEIVIATGGLGPTPDDVTREAVAELYRTPLVFHPAQWKSICLYFKKTKREPSLMTKREAYFPEMGQPIVNRWGIALGFFVWHQNRLLVVLPGVPKETERLFDESVHKIIRKFFKKKASLHELTANIIGMDEAVIMRRLGSRFFVNPAFEFGSYPRRGSVLLRFRSLSASEITKIKKYLTAKLKDAIYAFRDEPFEKTVAEQLIKKKMTLAIAESCTGGMLSQRLTNAPGSSRFFRGSVVAYANEVKEQILNVKPRLLKQYGAVSKETAAAMARGARHRFAAKLGISITGIAGPSGGTHQKPVGLIWIGFSTRDRTFARAYRLAGNRDRIRFMATQKSLQMLFVYLSKTRR
ncbi:MAG: hypothetical protein COV74_01555 [Candidatus Omnitrophica bacterium CG11_big_fil_rev_8_21_14_0_20_45_26]|uniref:CinA-like protein n=1 Tax=Candidatus Abzuiibacterium crystallinum TaxID=1974748 RepID=A0A2H0LU90_9BACT|nr:MAG: hypothetical protein COV74_01555 [Candidatus Omnitrophica bacterium CG11_big_fil_rev_8_21_14_0_20_45_26]PIW64983.1 MAG: hypothetical protein COW12_03835 [Candidatus Omnitrophica bacterium CG12_big_fil_rev_8_21_14_0_65_45_16]